MSASGASGVVSVAAVGVLVLALVRATGRKVFVTVSGGVLVALVIAAVLFAYA